MAQFEAMQSPAGVGPAGECSNCGALEATGGAALKPCARCNIAVYCGRECQRKHWKAPGGHKSAYVAVFT